jgi:DNA-directed RNA polymerase subunit RPC12/RpoP
MDEISCLVCGYAIKFPSHIDTEQYDGELRCDTCSARLHIKLVGSKVLKYKVVSEKQVAKSIADLYKRYEEQSKKE